MIFQFDNIPIIGIIPALLTIPTVILLSIFLFKYLKTHLKMLAYLTILYIFYLINHVLQAYQLFAITQESAEFYFIISEISKLIILYCLILIFEIFYRNVQFSGSLTIISFLVFIIIGGLISSPELNTLSLSIGFSVGFTRFSIIMILELIFVYIATAYILIVLIKSMKSAWGAKQKKLIIWLLIGSVMGVLIPSIPTVFIEQSPLAEQSIYFSMQIFQTITQNVGILIIGIAFLSVSKDPWLLQRQKVYFLIVYSHDGIKLYSRVFSKEINPEDTTLLAGAFSAVSSLIKESTKTTGKVNAILLEGKELRLISRKNFICALLVEYTTQASKWAQEKFTSEFNIKYGEKLENFDGEVSQFDSAEDIIKKYFS